MFSMALLNTSYRFSEQIGHDTVNVVRNTGKDVPAFTEAFADRVRDLACTPFHGRPRPEKKYPAGNLRDKHLHVLFMVSFHHEDKIRSAQLFVIK